MGIEFQILDALQKIHTPILDKFLDYTGSGVIDLSEDSKDRNYCGGCLNRRFNIVQCNLEESDCKDKTI